MLRDESQLRLCNLSLLVVLKGELELGEAVEEITGDLVEEEGAVVVILKVT